MSDPKSFEPFTIVLATHNQHKVKEILAIFGDTPIKILTLDNFPGAPDVVEDGKTLEENAQKKAYEIAKFTKHIALADDSGLEVDFLDGMPGVISARFAGASCSFADNNNKLLKLMKGVPTEHRKARFRCVMALALPKGATQTVEGSLSGYITDHSRGEEGFGYDPVFLVPDQGKTLAELGPTLKNSLSHRFKALQAMKPILLKLRENILGHVDKGAHGPPPISSKGDPLMSSRSAKLFAFILLAFFTGSILWWHHIDTRPSCLDETRHMQLAIDYRNFLAHGVPLTNEWSHVYPPLYHLSIIPALSIGTPSECKAALTHVFYLFLLLVGCVLFTRQAKRPDWEGVLAAILCAGYDFIFWESHRALLDFPLAALTTLAMALLFRTDGFSTWQASLVWGAALGAGLLIKVPFLFFSIGPVLWVYATSRQPHKTRNLLAGLALGIAICAPWYFWQSVYFLMKGSSLAMEQTGDTDPRTLAGWLVYIKMLRTQLGMPSLVVTLVGIALALFRKRLGGRGILIAWIISGYFILSLLVNKDVRHTLPLLPAMALLAAQGFGTLASGPWMPYALSILGLALMVFNVAAFDPPVKEDWKHAEIISFLVQQHDPAQPFLSVSILSHHLRFFARTLKWSAFQKGIALKPTSPGDANASFPELIIRRPGNQGMETATIEEQWQELHPGTRAFTSVFSVAQKFTLFDQSEAIIYRRIPHPRFHIHGLTREALGERIAMALGQWVEGPLKVSVEASDEGLLEGHLDRVRITCGECSAKGLPVRNIEVIAEKPWLNLYRLWDENRMGILAFGSFQPAVEVKAEDVLPMLSKVKGLTQPEVQFTDGHIRVKGRYKGIPVGAVAHVSVDHSSYPGLDAVLDEIIVYGIPIPGWLFGKVHRQTLILYPIPDFPGQILIDRVTTDKGELLVS